MKFGVLAPLLSIYSTNPNRKKDKISNEDANQYKDKSEVKFHS